MQRTVESLLGKADVHLNGDRPWDIQVSDNRCYPRWMTGSLGFGESYMDGWWECDDLPTLIAKLIKADLHTEILHPRMLFDWLKATALNLQRKGRKSLEVNDEHYNLGNDLFERMLDPLMVYTCGFWEDTKDLAQAQRNKLELICRKIGLEASDRVLDIGCGFGGFCKYAAENYGAQCVGITLSKEHKNYAEHACKDLPVDIRFQDYRDVDEKFDHIVSIEMIEAVGVKNFRTYFEVARKCLKDGGLFLLQAIGSYKSENRGDPWTDKYIFRNGMLPSIAQLGKATESLFTIEDLHNFGTHYEKTLLAWFANFDAGWHEIKDHYGDRFYRMWKYYLLSFAGAFRARYTQLWQIVLSPEGVPGGYIRPSLTRSSAESHDRSFDEACPEPSRRAQDLVGSKHAIGV